MCTRLGEILFGYHLDFYWCDFGIKSAAIQKYIDQVATPDMRILAELIYPVMGEIVVKPVDWLEWEDPFVFQKDALELKKERETSSDEDQKRLNYVIPTIQWLLQKSQG